MLKQLDILIGFVTVMSVVSMLIMIVTQMISSLFQLRGKKMCDALEAVFRTIAPDLDKKARAIAESVLRHPLISDSDKSGEKRGLAGAIRPGEIVAILKNLHDTQGKKGAWIGNETLDVKDDGEGTMSVEEVAKAAKVLLDKITGPAATNAASQALDDAVKVLGAVDPNAKDKLEAASKQVMEAVTNVKKHAQEAVMQVSSTIEGYFNMVEDRAKEWFATHTQIVNSILAVVFAIGLQLDTLALFQQLATDDVSRAKIVASAESVLKKTNEFLDTTAKPSPDAAEKLKTLSEHFNKTKDDLDGTGFNIVPKDYWKQFGAGKRHWLGMTITALLLSLGAPYWFNLLKTLTSFRSTLAKNVDEEKAAKKK